MRWNHSASPIAAIAGLAISSQALAQASFYEGFEDIGPASYSTPAALVSRGWVFRNQSQPVGTRGWYSGVTNDINSIYFNAQGGQRYLACDEWCTEANGGGQMSVWAILPPVSGQQAGDQVKLWARPARFAAETGFEIRYSPTGGIATGSGPAGVGDFTQVLLSVPSVTYGAWNTHSASVPGNGRVAIRYLGTHLGAGFGGHYVGIDSVSVGPPPAPPCNQPAIPAAGQTVTWTLAGSPYRVCQNVSIPTGATVNVEPGVRLDFDSERQLVVMGTLNLNGSEASRITLGGTSNYPPIVEVNNGTLAANCVDFGHALKVVNGGSTANLSRCTFIADNQTTGYGGQLESVGGFILLDRCTFSNSYLSTHNSMIVFQDTSLQHSYVNLLEGFVDFRGSNEVTGKTMFLLRHLNPQPIQISNLWAHGVPNDAAISITHTDALIGPNVTIQDNLYPVRTTGGILPGSQIPQTGNANNAIDTGIGVMYRPQVRWPDLGVPYHVTVPNNPIDPEFGGSIYVDDGVRIQHGPGCFLVGKYSELMLRGLPARPITLTGLTEGQFHTGPWYGASGSSRIEYATLERMQDGVTANATYGLSIENSVFQNNVFGTQLWGGSSAIVRKTRFLGNQTGVYANHHLNSVTNPNEFVGNQIAVLGPFDGWVDARNVWWNSPTGPRHPDNPGGTGEQIGGFEDTVQVLPFLTSAPDYSNHPPVVRMMAAPGMHPNQVQYLSHKTPPAVAGTKLVVQWQASDDDQIVAQKLQLRTVSPQTGAEVFTTIADLPPSQRSYELTLPDTGRPLGGLPFLLLTATDSRGQTGWDRQYLQIASGVLAGNLTFDDSWYAGQVRRPGDNPPESTFAESYPWEWGCGAQLMLEADDYRVDPFYVNRQYHVWDFEGLPQVSTDRARVIFYVHDDTNRSKAWYGGYFSIRPDPRLGWEPPQVSMTSPVNGQVIAGGGTVPIAWTASAQQGIYGFDIQASYDGGQVWHTFVKDLPAAARSYAWQLPASTGISGLRVRVIVRDNKFQNSASGDDRAFSVSPGSGGGPACYANCDQSVAPPVLNVLDFSCFLQKFASGHAYANCDQSVTPPVLNVQDFSCFLTRFAAGCP